MTILLQAITVYAMVGTAFLKNVEQCDYQYKERYVTCDNKYVGNLTEVKVTTRPVNTPVVQHLSLKNTALEHIARNVFKDVPELHLLDLSDNFLTSLDPNIFEPLKILLSLFLQNNNLYSLSDKRYFYYQKNLLYLNLDNNLLTTMSVDVLKPMVSLRELHMSGNPFVCDSTVNFTKLYCLTKNLTKLFCTPADYLQQVTTEKIILTEATTVAQVISTVTSTEHLQKFTTEKVTESDFTTTGKLAAGISSAFIFIVLVLVLLWCYRKKHSKDSSNRSNIKIGREVQVKKSNNLCKTSSYISVVPEPPERPIVDKPEALRRPKINTPTEAVMNNIKKENYDDIMNTATKANSFYCRGSYIYDIPGTSEREIKNNLMKTESNSVKFQKNNSDTDSDYTPYYITIN